MGMLRSAATKALWVAKGMAIFWGAVMTLALVFGAASVALAAVPGDPFKLGRANAVNALTQLTGTANDALLRIDNDSKGANATALELEVDPKKPPMRINSFAKVERLNADLLDGRESNQFVTITDKASDSDKLDGMDSLALLPSSTYEESRQESGIGNGSLIKVIARCDEGDRVLGGGHFSFSSSDDDYLHGSGPFLVSENIQDWRVTFADKGQTSTFLATALCADYPPLRP